MELVALGYFGVVLLLLWGATPAQKRWIGGTFALLIAIFIIGSLWIRYQTGFFRLDHWEWKNAGGSISLGKWAVPSYLLFAFLLLLLILFRFIQKTMAAPAEARVWLFIFAIFFTLIYAAAAYMRYFSSSFSFFRLRRDAVAMHKKLLGHEIRTCTRSMEDLKRIFALLFAIFSNNVSLCHFF